MAQQVARKVMSEFKRVLMNLSWMIETSHIDCRLWCASKIMRVYPGLSLVPKLHDQFPLCVYWLPCFSRHDTLLRHFRCYVIDSISIFRQLVRLTLQWSSGRLSCYVF
jgi:hypothetical protein